MRPILRIAIKEAWKKDFWRQEMPQIGTKYPVLLDTGSPRMERFWVWLRYSHICKGNEISHLWSICSPLRLEMFTKYISEGWLLAF